MEIFPILVLLTLCGIASHQIALDEIAKSIRKSGIYSSCTAPMIGKTTAGSNCGTFNIEIDGYGNVIAMFVLHKWDCD